ncbi:hypothetical protein [uncultured Jannaschia sp.]|uniref:hypothetical protein n=1 Tax=uncultured Jannaschia sp. TaxID=293347 RepID=UPI00260B0C70|nr:hypothetical protein [uncultured Jannaschia sp.]
MTFANVTRLPLGRDFRSVFDAGPAQTRFFLTVEDRIGIERLLRQRGTRNAPNPVLLEGLLRHKLRISRGAAEPAPQELVVAGCHVTYEIGGEDARSGMLAMNPVPFPGHVLVASLLGATLIGMRVLQRAPLLRDDGRIDTVFVLDVSPPPCHHAA